MKRACSVMAVMFVLMAVASSSAWAQPGGRGGFRGGFGFGGFGGTPNLLYLARVEAIQKEIEALDDQVAAIKKLEEELRAARDSQRGQGQRPDYQNMSDAEREKLRAEMTARMEKETATANAKVGEILLPHQIARLEQISLQQSMRFRGMGVLADAKIAAKLSLTDDQKKKIEAQSEAMRARVQELFQGGDRDQNREKMEQLRKESDEKYLALLTADQKAQFEKLKGETFQMPEGAFGPGGRQGRGDRGGDRGREGGKERPQRPNN